MASAPLVLFWAALLIDVAGTSFFAVWPLLGQVRHRPERVLDPCMRACILFWGAFMPWVVMS